MEELCQLFGPLLYVLRRHSFHLGSRGAGSGVELIDIKYWKFVPEFRILKVLVFVDVDIKVDLDLCHRLPH